MQPRTKAEALFKDFMTEGDGVTVAKCTIYTSAPTEPQPVARPATFPKPEDSM